MTSNHKLAANHSVLVDMAYFWVRITPETRPPQGAKLQLINERRGVATYGNWSPGSEWTHYAPLPRFHPNDKRGI